MSDKKYGLYKRIMKHDPKAIDEIETLEEAKEIIKMIVGNVYLNGERYQMEQEFIKNNIELLSGNKPKDDITLVGGMSNATNMDYMETINYVMNNITTQKDIYVSINERARMHIYLEKLGNVDWYRVDREVLSGNKFALDSTLSASELKELKRAVGISWMHLNEKSAEREIHVKGN